MTPEEVTNINNIVQLICKYQNKKRFLSKYTDFPRMRYLLKAFPDAQFIHILRDGRAVSNSYYNKIEAGIFNTWQEREWWIQGWPDSWRENWRKSHNNLLGFVAYQYKFFVKEIWEDAKYLQDNQYLEVRYEELMESPKRIVMNILRFCGLEFTKRIESYLDYTVFKNRNYKWKQDFHKEQQSLWKINLEEFLKIKLQFMFNPSMATFLVSLLLGKSKTLSYSEIGFRPFILGG